MMLLYGGRAKGLPCTYGGFHCLGTTGALHAFQRDSGEPKLPGEYHNRAYGPLTPQTERQSPHPNT